MSKLTDEQIRKLQAVENLDILNGQYEPYKFARAIEAAATEPLLQRIAELEQRNSDLHEDVQRFKKHALNEKAARLELERQLEEASKDAERYRWLRVRDNKDAKFAVVKEIFWRGAGDCDPFFYDSPDDLDEAIDAAMQKGKS